MANRFFLKSCSVVILFAVLFCVVLTLNSYRTSGVQISHVVLISIDTCRADYLGCYGYEKNTTPNIDAVAAEGTLFEFAYSPVPYTRPAHATMLTGTTPLRHNIHDNWSNLDTSNHTLAEMLKENGYKTGAVVSSYVLGSEFGLDQGFEYYYDKFGDWAGLKDVDERDGGFTQQWRDERAISQRRAGESTEIALQWLDEHAKDKSFLFLHYFDPHHEYDPPEPYASRFARNRYAGEIAYVDNCIGQVVDKLKALGLYDKTLLIITADHGEMLGEHGETSHGYFIYQSNIRVPLIIKAPGKNHPVRTKASVGLVDIVPTVCSQLGLERPSHLEGDDLSGFLFEKSSDDREKFIYCESLTPTYEGCNPLLGIINNSFKYIHTTKPELYDLKKDYGEKNNLVGKDPKRARFLRKHLEIILKDNLAKKTPKNKLGVDEETKRRLESLGYVAPSRKIDDSFEIDPNRCDPKDYWKDKADRYIAKNDRAVSLVNEGKLDEAVRAFEKIISDNKKAEVRHNMGVMHFNLAIVFKRLGRQEQAGNHFRLAINTILRDIEWSKSDLVGLYTIVGNCYAEIGNFLEASNSFKRVFEVDPSNVDNYINYAKTLEFQGRYDEAVSVISDGVEFLSKKGQPGITAKLEKYAEQLKQRRAKVR